MKKWIAMLLCLCLLLCAGAAMAEETESFTFEFQSEEFTLTIPVFQDVPYGYDNTDLKGTIQLRDSWNSPVVSTRGLYVEYTFDDQSWEKTEQPNGQVNYSDSISDMQIQLQPGLNPGEYTFGIKVLDTMEEKVLLNEAVTIRVLDPIWRVVNNGSYEVSPALANLRYGSPEQVEDALRALLEDAGYFVPGSLFDGVLQYSIDEGESWQDAPEGMRPSGKVKAWVEWTEDLGAADAEYMVVHMFDEGANAGGHEFCPAVTMTVDDVVYLVFEVTGNSPMLIGREAEMPALTAPAVPQIILVKEGGSDPARMKVEPDNDDYDYHWYQIVNGREVPSQNGLRPLFIIGPKAEGTVPAWTADDDGATFFCRVSTPAGAVDSPTFTLKLDRSSGEGEKEPGAPVEILSPAGKKTITALEGLTSDPLEVKAENAENVRWDVSTDGGKTWKDLGLDGIFTFCLQKTALSDAGLYRCTVSNENSEAFALFEVVVLSASSGVDGGTSVAPPKTGDNAPLALWFALCALTLAGAAACGMRIVRRKH